MLRSKGIILLVLAVAVVIATCAYLLGLTRPVAEVSPVVTTAQCLLLTIHDLNLSQYENVVRILHLHSGNILFNATIGFVQGYLDVREFVAGCRERIMSRLPENVTRLWRLGVRRPVTPVRIYFSDASILNTIFNTTICSNCVIVTNHTAYCLGLRLNSTNVLKIAYLSPDLSPSALKIFIARIVNYLRQLEKELGIKLVNASWENLSIDVLREVRKRLDRFGNVKLKVVPIRIVRPWELPKPFRTTLDFVVIAPRSLVENLLLSYEKQYWPTYTRLTLVLVTNSSELVDKLRAITPQVEIQQMPCMQALEEATRLLS